MKDKNFEYRQLSLMKKYKFARGRINVECFRMNHLSFHIHDGLEILYLIEGSLRVRISYEDYAMKKAIFSW